MAELVGDEVVCDVPGSLCSIREARGAARLLAPTRPAARTRCRRPRSSLRVHQRDFRIAAGRERPCRGALRVAGSRLIRHRREAEYGVIDMAGSGIWSSR